MPACLLRCPLLPSFQSRIAKCRMQRVKRRVRYLLHSGRGFLWRPRPEWRLWVIFQSQRKEPRIVLSPQLRGDAKSKINSRRNAAGGDAVTVLHYTIDDKLCSKLRQDVTHRPVRRSFVAAQKASRTKNHGSRAHARYELGGLSTQGQKVEGFVVGHERNGAIAAAPQ